MAQGPLTVDTDQFPVDSVLNILTQEGVSEQATVGDPIVPASVGAGLGVALNNRTENTTFQAGNTILAMTPTAPDAFVFQGDATKWALTDPDLGVLTYLGTDPAPCLIELVAQVGFNAAVLAPALYMLAISVNGDLDGLGWFDPAVFRAGGAPGTLPITPENVYATVVSRRFVTVNNGDTVKAVGAGDTTTLTCIASTLTAQL